MSVTIVHYLQLVMPTLGWRWLLALSALPSSVLLLFYWSTPESPRYLCMIGKKTDARIVLEKISKMNGTKIPSGVLVSDHQIELHETSSEDASFLPPREDNQTPDSVNSSKGSLPLLLMLVSPELIRSTLLLWVVFFGNAFAYYGLVLLSTELSSTNHNCIPSKELQSTKSQSVDYGDVLITSLAEIPGLLLAAATVDKLGRKTSMSSMFFLCSIFLFPLVSHQPQSLTTGLLFGARICITATFTIIYLYAPELYPTSVRTTGVGVASSVGRIGGMVCPLVAVGLIHGCHQTLAIILFQSVILVSGFSVLLFPFETKGRELKDRVQSEPDISASEE